jgi:hypothetical protein
MLVAAGSAYSRWLNIMRELKRKGLVDLVYPEFFDDKDSLIAKQWSTYIRRLRRHADVVKVAVWPDYCYDARLRGRFSVEWVFPLHHRSELDFALNVADYVAFPNRDDLRDYTLGWFLEQKRAYGFKAWLLGLKPRYICKLHVFDACDLTAVSLPGYRYSKWHEIPLEVWERFVQRIKTAKAFALDPWLEG